MNLSGLVTAVARRDGGRPAVSQGAVRWSYADLAGRIARGAAGLRALPGVEPGARVAIAMENAPAFFQTLFACWHAGLCAVPVNAKLHAREIAFILEDTGAALCVTSPALHDAVASELGGKAAPRLLATDSAAFAALDEAPAMAAVDRAPDDPAWLFYTSGTTGRPKGAVLTGRNLLYMTLSYGSDLLAVRPGDTMIHPAPLSHGSGLYSLPHLAKGGHQVIPPSGHFDPAETLALIAEHPAVSFFAAPTIVTRLMNSPAMAGADLSNLAAIVYGGGPMYVADLERAIDLFGPRLVQIYGQGESPMTITALTLADHADRDHPRRRERLASCGTARTGVEVRILDPDGRELPPGAVGEVATRSDCVMAGYWRNPKATADALRDGWLLTGDMGSLDEDGYLTLKDRSKDLIISGGSNIYPREVEEALLLHPRVVEVSVIGAPHADWGEEVVAFVVGDGATEAELDALCLQHIARFKRPKRYVFVERLPKNNYGKVLKTELRRMVGGGSREPARQPGAPR